MEGLTRAGHFRASPLEADERNNMPTTIDLIRK